MEVQQPPGTGIAPETFFFSGIPFMLSFVRSFFYIPDKWRCIFEGLWLGMSTSLQWLD